MAQSVPLGMIGIERDAATFGAHKEWSTEHNRIEWEVKCACGAWDRRPFTTNTSPEVMMKKWKQHGWLLAKGDTPICPECRTPKKEPGMTTPAKIIPDMKVTRRVMEALTEHFDQQVHRYKGTWNDANVANHVGCSADLVAHIRVDAGYGEIAQDPELVEVRAELDTLMDDMEGQIEGLRNEFLATSTSIVDKFKNEMSALKGQTEQDIVATVALFHEKYDTLSARVPAKLNKKAS